MYLEKPKRLIIWKRGSTRQQDVQVKKQN